MAQPTSADLELKASKIADPGVDLKTKLSIAGEIRDTVDAVKDTDTPRVVPFIITVVIEFLRNTQPSFVRDSLEFQLRRTLVEVLHRTPLLETIRPQAQTLCSGLLQVIGNDTEDNAITCCKILMDLVRNYRPLTEESLQQFIATIQTVFRNLPSLVEELLSENSPPLDPNIIHSSTRSFKVFAELATTVVVLLQNHRVIVSPVLAESQSVYFDVLTIQSPAQKKTREDHEAKGKYWSGVASNMPNTQAYTDLIVGQVKMISFLMFFLRSQEKTGEKEIEALILATLRLLQDCPPSATASRKDLVIVFRYLVSTPQRRVLIPLIDKLLDEHVLLGASLSSQETVRATALGSIADLVHHLRTDLQPAQLSRACIAFLRHLHNPYLSNTVHIISARTLYSVAEVIISKDTPQNASKLFSCLLDGCVDKVESMALVLKGVHAQAELAKEKGERTEETVVDHRLVEKARPIASATYAVERTEELIPEYRALFRQLEHAIRGCISGLKKCDGPIPDGVLISRLFEACIECLSLFDGIEQREFNDAMEYLAVILAEVNLHVFQEVMTSKMDFLNAAVERRPALMHIANSLFNRESHSPTLTAIVLRFCMNHLEELGELEEQKAAIAIKWFKTIFMAVQVHPAVNEPILVTQAVKLVMDCFPLSAKASKPTHYYHLLRGLFRTIGGGSVRFDTLYKEIHPLLPEMLDNLNRLLLIKEGQAKDMIAELCLTVPLRLTHLLPYLPYLMQPLRVAIRGGIELAAQAMRTLELCIDNLTPEFLDPTLSVVIREIMEALFNNLKPLPANHHQAHTTIRVLAKMGGRNRRLLTMEPHMRYNIHPESTVVRFSFAGLQGSMKIAPGVNIACWTIRQGKNCVPYRAYAFSYLEATAYLLLSEARSGLSDVGLNADLSFQGVKGRDREELFTRCMEAMWDATLLPETQEGAENFLRLVSLHILTSELRRPPSKDSLHRRHPGPLFSSLLESIAHGFSRDNVQDATKTHNVLATILREFITTACPTESSVMEVRPTFNYLAARFTSLCLEETWSRKSAGCRGIRLMPELPILGPRWVTDRVIEIVRTLLHVLKDMTFDLPQNIAEVSETLAKVLRVACADVSQLDNLKPEESMSGPKQVILALIGILFAELSGQNAIVRKAAQDCIELLTQLTGVPTVELLMPHRERMLTAIYTKPLRALPFPAQIGMVEGIRYCLSLDPPLPEASEELLRLLHEALALADADDVSLMTRGNPRQNAIEITKLRVACIKLLTASMPLTDFFAKQQNTRQRVTAVYFKSLYSTVAEVKDVAHEGLRMVLQHQARLPKELLQTGLRPILMNLADSKRLSAQGLEALSRLLKLLTNYFKVEIGHKLLDHFRVIADPQMLQASSRLPLSENDGIAKLVQIANIFHLLPASANMFLENLVNSIVQTEAQMHFSGQSPFSEPLAKYLDRYPIEAVDFFMRHLQFPRHVRTLRSILQARLAPRLLRELESRFIAIVSNCLSGREANLVLPGLQLSLDIAELVPTWLTENPFVIQTLLTLWQHDVSPQEFDPQTNLELIQRHALLLSIFMLALKQSPRVDLLFEIVSIFTRNLPQDPVRVSEFLYKHVALSDSLTYRRNVLAMFMTWFTAEGRSYAHKTYVMRFIITPIILVNAARPTKEGLLDSDMIQWFHTHVWIPMNDESTTKDVDDIFKIELLHFTTVMVHQYPELLVDAKKDIIKCAWHHIHNEDAIVKHTAYLLAARFFEAWEGPQKFTLTVWSGLLSRPHSEGKALVRQALDILAPVLQRSSASEPGYPQWARTTRRLLAEESGGWSQVGLIYQLMVRQSGLFYPVRALFIPHVVNSVSKLGLSPSSTIESRLLSVEVLQVIFDWEQKAMAANSADVDMDNPTTPQWTTPLPFRESMVSYLVRLSTLPMEVQSRNVVVPRAVNLLRALVSPTGWTDVTVKLHYFARMLHQNEIHTEQALTSAACAAKVLQAISNQKPDSWFIENAEILNKLVRRGLVSEDPMLQDALYTVLERLLKLFPLPKEDEDMQGDMAEFFQWVHVEMAECIKNNANVRGGLLILKAAVQVVPERVQPYSAHLMRLLATKSKDLQSASNQTAEAQVRTVMLILEVSKLGVAYLGEQKRTLLSAMVTLIEKSRNLALCRYILDIGREWALQSREAQPTMKEKATLLHKMGTLDRGDTLTQAYLELIYDIYTEPSLRRSELTARLEPAFLLGCRAIDTATREKFIDLLDANIPRSLYTRLVYIFGVQSWESLSDRNWIYIALHLLLGCVDGDASLVPDRKTAMDTQPTTTPFALGRVASIIRPMQRLLFLDPQKAHDAWVSVFPTAWACLSRREQVDLTHHIISLLSKEHLLGQSDVRPNVIETILAGVAACSPTILLSPHLVKYLAKNFGVWHVSLQILESSLDSVREDETMVRDTVYDALAEVYAELAEEDLFYGLWRRRSLFPETNLAVAYEQCGFWEQASTVYEAAQAKSRSGLLPFNESEYCLWEDHWQLAAEKLQQWDTLHELGKSENNYELMLECAWRTKDWWENKDTIQTYLNALPIAGTPRRRVFEAFMALIKAPSAVEKNVEFTRILEDAMQLTLRKWIGLPTRLSPAHIPLLHHFQQFVELQEAVQIFGSLSNTNAANLEKKSSDLKLVLQAWRERLPNRDDDITLWSDLVAWRQNVFGAINKTYIPLINQNNTPGAPQGTTNTYGFRGYHETAWIINRFAQTARKHGLLDVCVGSLNKIYTLPNIEISEAFLKLREQARCHFQKPGELAQGLEVINNTNLMYFSTPQKAEFYTLKAKFYEKLDQPQQADAAYGQAVQLDWNQAKAWAAWGKYNDRIFKSNGDLGTAAQAVNCYLQAAGMFKNQKSRPLLARVLWLLSIDDAQLMISRAFDTYKGDAAWWYWIPFIPQLCLSLSHREVKQARYVLLNLAKLYPQALFFHLRTTREDMADVKRRLTAAANLRNANHAQQAANDGDVNMDGGKSEMNGAQAAAAAAAAAVAAAANVAPHAVRQASELIDEVGQMLKTAFPLLTMSLETMVDQIGSRFKSTPEEEIYRLICMLMQDAIMQYVGRVAYTDDNGLMLPQTVQQLMRLGTNLNGPARKEYEEDFVKPKLTLAEYIQRLNLWREKYERYLDSRPRLQSLDTISHYLAEYPHGKYDDIEIPGQYTEEKEHNATFVRLQRFGSKFENCRANTYCFRRFTMHGHDCSKMTFAVQLPAGRHCRREERMMQVLRTFNEALTRKKESNRRFLHFHIPATIPCGPSMRLLQNDSSYVSMGDIFDQYCEENGITREDPLFLIADKIRTTFRLYKQKHGQLPAKHEQAVLKKDMLDEVRSKIVPEDVITRYFLRTMDGPTEMWRMRKEFTLQVASMSFMTYVFGLTSRVPSRFHISRLTGQIAMSEVLPGITTVGASMQNGNATITVPQPAIHSSDPVPFRLTPNMQHFIGPIFTEGILATGIMSIARSLTQPDFELEQQLCLFARDEIVTWCHGQKRPWTHDVQFRVNAAALIDSLVKKAETMACKTEREQATNMQNVQGGNAPVVLNTVTNLISTATNPINLAKMPEAFMAWF